MPSRDLRFLPADANGEQRRAGRRSAARGGVPARAVGIPLPGGGECGVLRERLAARHQAALVLCRLGRGGAELPDRGGRLSFSGAGRRITRGTRSGSCRRASAGYAYPYLTRPILPGCLTCHASYLKPVEGTQNRYALARLRGGRRRLRAMSRRRRVARRDRQSREARARPPRQRVRAVSPVGRGAGAARGYGLAIVPAGRPPFRFGADVCARGRRAGDDGHEPRRETGAERVQTGVGRQAVVRVVPRPAHRQRDLRRLSSRRRAAGAGRTAPGCHMPKSTVRDAQHVVYTDHSIPRRPRPRWPRSAASWSFSAEGKASDRDLGLAYAISGDRERAASAAGEGGRPGGAGLPRRDRAGGGRRPKGGGAVSEGIGARAGGCEALVGLGAIVFERGEYGETVQLWSDAASRNPGLVLARTNLAMAQWRSGDREGARATLRAVIELSPAFQPPAELLGRLGR